MSCPTLELRNTALRSITRMRPCGAAAAQGAAANITLAAMASRPRKDALFVIGLISCASSEMKYLGPVVAGLDERHAQVDADRSEGRLPPDRHAGGGAECEVVLHGIQTGFVRSANVGLVVEMAQRAEIAEQREAYPVIFGQEVGHAQLRRADRIGVAAQGADVLGHAQVARSDAGE